MVAGGLGHRRVQFGDDQPGPGIVLGPGPRQRIAAAADEKGVGGEFQHGVRNIETLHHQFVDKLDIGAVQEAGVVLVVDAVDQMIERHQLAGAAGLGAEIGNTNAEIIAFHITGRLEGFNPVSPQAEQAAAADQQQQDQQPQAVGDGKSQGQQAIDDGNGNHRAGRTDPGNEQISRRQGAGDAAQGAQRIHAADDLAMAAGDILIDGDFGEDRRDDTDEQAGQQEQRRCQQDDGGDGAEAAAQQQAGQFPNQNQHGQAAQSRQPQGKGDPAGAGAGTHMGRGQPAADPVTRRQPGQDDGDHRRPGIERHAHIGRQQPAGDDLDDQAAGGTDENSDAVGNLLHGGMSSRGGLTLINSK